MRIFDIVRLSETLFIDKHFFGSFFDNSDLSFINI